MIGLLLVSAFLAGCAEGLPSPDEYFGEEEITTEWQTLSGEFTLVMDNESNETLLTAPTIWIDVNTTYGLIELGGFNYTAEHLSFEIVNNSVIFHNYTFSMQGYLIQVVDGQYVQWNEGYASEFGNATLHFAKFPFDVTVTYDVTYRIWDGRE